MRLIGQAEMALEKMCKRAVVRVAFGRPVADQGVTRERIAEARIMIEFGTTADTRCGVENGYIGQQGRPPTAPTRCIAIRSRGWSSASWQSEILIKQSLEAWR